MIRKCTYAMAVSIAILAGSCKKDDAVSKIDPNATDVPMSTATPNPEANIGGPDLPAADKPAPPADGKYPVMTFETYDHDFGNINEGDKVEYVFHFKNTGAADLIISNAKGSCGCTIPEYPKEPIAPGKGGEMKVSFNSAGKHGKQTKTVTITANTAMGEEKLTIHASINDKKTS